MAPGVSPERDDHSSWVVVTEHLIATYPDDRPGNRPGMREHTMSSLFGLAPGGVYHAASIAGRAVGSYPTFSPLPGQHINSAKIEIIDV